MDSMPVDALGSPSAPLPEPMGFLAEQPAQCAARPRLEAPKGPSKPFPKLPLKFEKFSD